MISGIFDSGVFSVISNSSKIEWTIMLAVMLHEVRRRSVTRSMVMAIAVMACPPCAGA